MIVLRLVLPFAFLQSLGGESQANSMFLVIPTQQGTNDPANGTNVELGIGNTTEQYRTRETICLEKKIPFNSIRRLLPASEGSAKSRFNVDHFYDRRMTGSSSFHGATSVVAPTRIVETALLLWLLLLLGCLGGENSGRIMAHVTSYTRWWRPGRCSVTTTHGKPTAVTTAGVV
jgi:hypothetical protein